MLKNAVKIARNFFVGYGRPVFIIAEAGVNHNGSLRIARKLIDAAVSCGADAVKFQTFKTENLVLPQAPAAEYQKKFLPRAAQAEMLKRLELSYGDFEKLFSYCAKKKIMFLSTPFDPESAEFLKKLGIECFKISSGDLTNIPFLKQIAGYKKPMIISTGMAVMPEVKEAVKAVYGAGNKNIVLLHCTSSYPADYENVNLRAITTLRRAFDIPVGYSDHTPGIEIACAAATLGAVVVEKHFTLDRRMPGPDHKASLEPDNFKNMVTCIRNIEKALGNGAKSPCAKEKEISAVVRKSIAAARDIKSGAVINRDMLVIKRPGSGIAPKFFDKLIGKTAKKDIKKDSILLWGDIK